MKEQTLLWMGKLRVTQDTKKLTQSYWEKGSNNFWILKSTTFNLTTCCLHVFHPCYVWNKEKVNN